MATTDHPLVLDLGQVRGLSVYQEWKTIEGNENKTFEEFLEVIANLGIQIRVTNVVEQGNTDAVSSGGVWDKLLELGLLEREEKPTPGSSMERVFSYTLGDNITPDEGDDLSDWIDSSTGTNNVWTLTPEPGQEWHVDNGGTVAKTLSVVLPSDAPTGARICVTFRPDGTIEECADITISSGGIVVMGGSAPSVIGGVSIECSMSKYGWIVIRHYATGAAEVVIVTKSARIVYSGANHESLKSTSYNTNVVWSGDASTIPSTKSAQLRNDIFRKLYGTASFRGWTTSKTGTTVTHADHATVTLSNGQTLTLYPLFTSTDVNVKLGKTSVSTIITQAGGSSKTETFTYTFKPSSYISGYKGEPYKIKIYGSIESGEDHFSSLEYQVDSGSWVTICSQPGRSSASNTKTVSLSGTGSHTVKFRVYQEAGSGYCGSDYKCYVSKMTIS